jgi:hypothetical protein
MLTRTAAVSRHLGTFPDADTHNHSKAPDLPVSPGRNPLLEIPFHFVSITAILVNAAYDERHFLLVEEAPMWLLENLIRKANQKEVAENASGAGHDTFNDEDPSPAHVSSNTILQ